MKGKKQKKRNDEPLHCNNTVRQQAPPSLKIKFDLCQDSIACFIGQKRSAKKRTRKPSLSLKKCKPSYPKNLPMQPQPPKATLRLPQTQSEQIVQGSLNTILSEIENKGILCAWSEGEETMQIDQNLQNQTSELWSAFSVNSSVQKSPASTIDVRPNVVYYMDESYYQPYPYPYIKNYEEGSFLLRPDELMEDPRTTAMIRNIPNKYTIKELSEQIDQVLPNTYDFLYLPCDIKNQCNVGYGFINFLNTQYLAEFYKNFQGRRWAKFRSEKICNITYARLQGLDNLIDHFENSKVLNQKDKKYRPIIREFTKIENLIKTQQLH